MEGIINNWLNEELPKRRQKYAKGQDIQDFVDAFVAYEQSTTSNMPMSEAQFRRSMVDMFIAGLETTSQSTSWMLLYLAHYPQWQEKIYEEISSVIPGNSMPKIGDRSKMPLLEAFCNEVHRHASFVGVFFLLYFYFGSLKIKKKKIFFSVCFLSPRERHVQIWET